MQRFILALKLSLNFLSLGNMLPGLSLGAVAPRSIQQPKAGDFVFAIRAWPKFTVLGGRRSSYRASFLSWNKIEIALSW